LLASEVSLKDALKVARAGSMNHVDPEGSQTLIVPVTRNAHVLLGRRTSSTSVGAMNSRSQNLTSSRSQDLSKSKISNEDIVRQPAGLQDSMEIADNEETTNGKPVVKANHERKKGHDGSTTSGSSTSKEARQRRINRSQLEGRLSRSVLGNHRLLGTHYLYCLAFKAKLPLFSVFFGIMIITR
jgi:hypothetical protein